LSPDFSGDFLDGGFGSALELWASDVSIDRCRFENNQTNLKNGSDNHQSQPWDGYGFSSPLGVNVHADHSFVSSVRQQDQQVMDAFKDQLEQELPCEGSGQLSNGGAIAAMLGKLVVTNSEFIGNKAGRAGAVYLGVAQKAAFTNCAFVGNEAKDPGIYAKDFGMGHRPDWSGVTGTTHYYDDQCNVGNHRSLLAGLWGSNPYGNANAMIPGTGSYVARLPNDGWISGIIAEEQLYRDDAPRFTFARKHYFPDAVDGTGANFGWRRWNAWARALTPPGGEALVTNAGAILADYSTETHLTNCVFWDNKRKDELWTRITAGWTVGNHNCDHEDVMKFGPAVLTDLSHMLGSPRDPLNHVSGVNIKWNNSCIEFGDRPVALLDIASVDGDVLLFEWLSGDDIPRKMVPGASATSSCWLDYLRADGHPDDGLLYCQNVVAPAFDNNNLAPNLGDPQAVVHSQIGSILHDAWSAGIYPDSEGTFSDAEIVTGDPGFVSLSAGNLNLNDGSSCINAGFSAVDIDPFTPGTQALPALDLNGNPRVSGTAVDIGARESSGD